MVLIYCNCSAIKVLQFVFDKVGSVIDDSDS